MTMTTAMKLSPRRNPKTDKFLGLRFRHPQLEGVHEAIGRCHATNGRNARCTLISGDTGIGKTQAIESYIARYPSIDHPAWTQIRVLYVSLKQRTTTKEIILKLYRALGIRRRGGTEGELFEDLLELLPRCGVELIVIDEVQHVLPGHSHRRLQETRDFFKSLLDQSQVPLVFVGLPKAVGLLESPDEATVSKKPKSASRLSFITGEEGDQLKDRTQRGYRMCPYAIDSKPWRKVLGSYQKSVGVPCLSLASDELAYRCWLASKGRLRRMSNILGEAIEITEGARQITKKTLADAFDRVESLQDSSLGNPFLMSVSQLDKHVGAILTEAGK